MVRGRQSRAFLRGSNPLSHMGFTDHHRFIIKRQHRITRGSAATASVIEPLIRGWIMKRHSLFGACAISLGVVTMLGASGRSAAHHSFAMFDTSRRVTLHGVVKEFRWNNPHVFIQLMVMAPDEGGAIDEWSIEMTSPEHLARIGWRPRTLKSGDEVTIVIHPSHGRSTAGQYVSGTGPDGAVIGGAPRKDEARGAGK